MELKNRKRRPRRVTAIIRILHDIRIESPRARRNRREVLPKLRRARERPREAASVRLASGVDAAVVDAEGVAEVVYEVAGEFLV